MAMVVLPREWMHEHAPEGICTEGAEHAHRDHDAAVDEDCAICAMDMLLAVPASVSADVVLTGLVTARTEVRILPGTAAPAHLPVDRGPPTRA